MKFYSHRCLRCSWPLLGADFLRVNSLLVDLKGKRLVNAETYLSTPLQKAKERAPHLGAISISTDTYAKLLTKFPEIMVPNFSKTSTKHQVEHYITTKGPLVHAHVRQLPPDKLETAKAEFKRWETWASYSVHLVNGHHCSTWCLRL